jgi:hypothetical protein
MTFRVLKSKQLPHQRLLCDSNTGFLHVRIADGSVEKIPECPIADRWVVWIEQPRKRIAVERFLPGLHGFSSLSSRQKVDPSPLSLLGRAFSTEQRPFLTFAAIRKYTIAHLAPLPLTNFQRAPHCHTVL